MATKTVLPCAADATSRLPIGSKVEAVFNATFAMSVCSTPPRGKNNEERKGVSRERERENNVPVLWI